VPRWILIWAASFGLCIPAAAAESAPANWTGNYPVCTERDRLLQPGPLSIRARILTRNPILAEQFAKAMDFWAGVLELEWHRVDTEDCAIALVDGASDLFAESGPCQCIGARSHSPDRAAFQGWIAFNPAARLSEEELLRTSIHEIGHLLGLGHNSSADSVMFFLDVSGPVALDEADLRALAARHTLREGVSAAVR
jgi:hypothetical protein